MTAWVTRLALIATVLAGTAAVVTATGPGQVSQVAQAQPVAAPDQAANQDYVPVDQLPQDEGLPAAPLVMTAYGFAWVMLAIYLWSIWRRLGRVEHEMASVRARIEQGRGQP